MASRLELQSLLEELLGSRNVYYQPPESIRMSYPAIVYSFQDIRNRYANDTVYTQAQSYQLTLIDEDPDNEMKNKISQLKMCSFDRHFKSGNLNHYVFTIYF